MELIIISSCLFTFFVGFFVGSKTVKQEKVIKLGKNVFMRGKDNTKEDMPDGEYRTDGGIDFKVRSF